MLMSGERTEFRSRSDNLQIELTRIVIGAHDTNGTRMPRAIAADLRPGQKSSECLNWIKRRRKADTSRTS